MIQVRKHQKIIIPVFAGTHISRPILARSKDFVYCGFGAVQIIVIGAVEVLPSVFEFAVCVAAGGKIKAYPCFYFLRFCEVDVPI